MPSNVAISLSSNRAVLNKLFHRNCTCQINYHHNKYTVYVISLIRKTISCAGTMTSAILSSSTRQTNSYLSYETIPVASIAVSLHRRDLQYIGPLTQCTQTTTTA